jgi:hypothetical protein
VRALCVGLAVLAACGDSVPQPAPLFLFDRSSFDTAVGPRALAPIRGASVAVSFEHPGSVRVLDRTMRLSSDIPAGAGVRALTYAESIGRIITADAGNRSLTLIDPAGFATSSIALDHAPLDLAYDMGALFVLTGPLASEARIEHRDASSESLPLVMAEPLPDAETIAMNDLDESASHFLIALLGSKSELLVLDASLTEHARAEVCDDPRAVSAADLDGAGEREIVVACGSGGIDVISDGGRGTRAHFPGGSRLYDLALVDLDGDGETDAAAADVSGDAVILWRGLGSAGFDAYQVYAVGMGPVAITSVDLDENGSPDLVVAALEARKIELLLQRRLR